MKEYNPKLQILPWYDSDMGEDIVKTFKDILSSLFLFKKYFQRAMPKDKGGMIYNDVYISHCRPMNEIKGDLEWFLKKNKCSIFVNEIQSEKNARLGWLLFSFQGLDCKKLTIEITELCMVEILAIYKPILTDKWDPTIGTTKKTKSDASRVRRFRES